MRKTVDIIRLVTQTKLTMQAVAAGAPAGGGDKQTTQPPDQVVLTQLGSQLAQMQRTERSL